MSGFINYDTLVDDAMRDVSRRILHYVSVNGVQGDHHIMISFNTNCKGVQLSSRLKSQYPEEMTIILQYQYQDLRVERDYFSISLSFNRISESITIPYRSIIYIADPSVEFGLQFHDYGDDHDLFSDEDSVNSLSHVLSDHPPKDSEAIDQRAEKAKVFSLDAFRKKK